MPGEQSWLRERLSGVRMDSTFGQTAWVGVQECAVIACGDARDLTRSWEGGDCFAAPA